MIGIKVGSWLITKELGDGGHAFVFQGIHPPDVAAVKMLKPSVAGEDNLERRFQVEAEVLRALRHPAIVGFKEYIYINGFHYLVMEFMDAGSVDHVLRKSGRLEPRYALPIISKVLDGLLHAHSFGYIHRDIKPNNILLNKKGAAKLTDFGIAKVVGGETLTRKGFVVGTTQYLAPEYLSEGVVNVQTDIYGVGVTLYEMLTNRRPFEYDAAKEPIVSFVKRVCTTDPPLPSSLCSLPDPLERMLLKALARDPRKRYRTIDKLRGEMRKAFPDLVERAVAVPDGRVRTGLIEMGKGSSSPLVESAGTRSRFATPAVRPGALFLVAIILGALAAVGSQLWLGWTSFSSALLAVATAGAVLGLCFLQTRVARSSARRATREASPAPLEERRRGEEERDALPPQEAKAVPDVFEETQLSELNAFLEAIDGASKGRRWGLRPVSRIGRNLRYDVRPKDPKISRGHAMIAFNGVDFVVRDLGSTNGTFVNEERVTAEQVLVAGDILHVGSTRLRFVREDAPESSA